MRRAADPSVYPHLDWLTAELRTVLTVIAKGGRYRFDPAESVRRAVPTAVLCASRAER